MFQPEAREVGKGEYRGLEFLHVEAKRLINAIPPAARLPFRYTINAYRGCSHACTYCFARPTHAYLDLGIGADFETKIVVKINAVDLARAETAPGRWAGDAIAMGTNTDPYQPAEGKYRLTQGIIAVLAERGVPFSILTKSSLVLRDLDLLRDAAGRTDVAVNLSIPTLDEDVWRITEPGTPHPRRRVETVARLREAGVRSGVLVAPVLPGLSDRRDQLEEVVAACVAAGADFIHAMYLHLRPGLREHYLRWLATARPDLLPCYQRRYRDRAYAPRPAQRRLAATVAGLVAQHGGRARPRPPPAPPAPPAPAPPPQLRLGP